MCCFSVAVQQVADTKIFARLIPGGQQYLVYSMTVSANQEGAMVLPLPVTQSASEDAVHFINLENYPTFFDDLARCFPVMLSRSIVSVVAQAAPVLRVISVGSFEASFVPTIQDFQRLDERFRLPDKVWRSLPDYQDYGFAVFKLKAGAMNVHPMAFTFPTRSPDSLFFPTLHIHDSKVHWLAKFDHHLYCQSTAVPTQALEDWEQSGHLLGEILDADKAQGIIDPALCCYRLKLQGRQRNRDTWVY